MTLRSIREEIAEVLAEALPALTVYDYVPVEPDTPSAWPAWPLTIPKTGPQVTADGATTFTLPIVLCVGLSEPRTAQVMLDRISTITAPNALEAHAWQSCRALTVVDIGPPTPDETGRLLVAINTRIHALLTNTD